MLFTTAPLFLIDVWRWSTLEAGFALALNQVSAAVVGIAAGRWADRNGHTGVIVAGGVLGAIGHGWLAWAAGAEVQVWSVLVPSFVVGGVGSMLIGSTISAAAFRDDGEAGCPQRIFVDFGCRDKTGFGFGRPGQRKGQIAFTDRHDVVNAKSGAGLQKPVDL